METETTLKSWRSGGNGAPERGLDITTRFVECWELVSAEDSTSRYCSHDAFLAGELHSLIAGAFGEEVLEEAVALLVSRTP